MSARGLLAGSFAAGLVLCCGQCVAAELVPANQMIPMLVEHERGAYEHREHYMYVAKERSERTGGHEWTERVIETSAGKIHMLIAEDGVPLSPERVAQERSRLAAIAADPAAFAKREQTQKNDEEHARQMLELLPKAFLFENARMEGTYERIDFRPNPSYSPQSMEERVLHGMTGSMLVDPATKRLHRLEGTLPQDVTIGLGLLATIRAGSRFATERVLAAGDEWKTSMIDTDVNGRAIFFKSISRKQHSEHGEFKQVPGDLTVAQAVEMVER